jgi:hypothetical protein
MQEILVGCDPEVFVRRNGVFESAHNLIPGDKRNPHKVNCGAVQVDGMALEFNIDPASTEEMFLYNVQTVYDIMKSMVPGHEVVATPVAHFSLEYLRKQPQEALELGCDPDFNAWSRTINPRPDGERPMRTASGHVHVGWTSGEDPTEEGHLSRAEAVVRQLDFALGLPSLVYDADTLRREMYGKAGAYRPKTYGVEYRTLSNAWLNSPELIKWVFRVTQRAVRALMEGNSYAERHGDIQQIINSSDVKAAMAIIKAEKLEIPRG